MAVSLPGLPLAACLNIKEIEAPPASFTLLALAHTELCSSNRSSRPCHRRCSSCSSSIIVVAATGGVIVPAVILSFVIVAVALVSKVSRSAMLL